MGQDRWLDTLSLMDGRDLHLAARIAIDLSSSLSMRKD